MERNEYCYRLLPQDASHVTGNIPDSSDLEKVKVPESTVSEFKNVVISKCRLPCTPQEITVYEGDGKGTWHSVNDDKSLRVDGSARKDLKEYRVVFPPHFSEQRLKKCICRATCGLNRRQLLTQGLFMEVPCAKEGSRYHCNVCGLNVDDHVQTPSNSHERGAESEVASEFHHMAIDDDTVYFPDSQPFRGIPAIGKGVRGSTAFPMRKICDRISRRREGIVWIDAPPLSGKTSLGDILKFRYNFILMSCDEKEKDNTTILRDVSNNPIYVDEAQWLKIPEIAQLREMATTRLVVCAATSGIPFQPCKMQECQQNDQRHSVCGKCEQHKCHATSTCSESGTDTHDWLDTASLIKDRIGMTEFVIDETQLTEYFKAIEWKERNSTIGPLFDNQRAIKKAISYTGGVLGFIMAVIFALLKDPNKQFQPSLYYREFMKLMHSDTTLSYIKTDRFATCTEDIETPVVEFFREFKQPEQSVGDMMRARGWIRLKLDNTMWEPSSPLVFLIMYRHLFCGSPPEFLPLTTIYGAVVYALSQMRRNDFVDEKNNFLHEDLINGTMSSWWKRLQSTNLTYKGLPKSKSKGKRGIVDHQLIGSELVDGPFLIEVCLSNSRPHCKRFNATGNYQDLYTYKSAIVVNFSLLGGKGKGIKAFELDDERCHFLHVYVRDNGFELYHPKARAEPKLGCIWLGMIPFAPEK